MWGGIGSRRYWQRRRRTCPLYPLLPPGTVGGSAGADGSLPIADAPNPRPQIYTIYCKHKVWRRVIGKVVAEASPRSAPCCPPRPKGTSAALPATSCHLGCLQPNRDASVVAETQTPASPPPPPPTHTATTHTYTAPTHAGRPGAGGLQLRFHQDLPQPIIHGAGPSLHVPGRRPEAERGHWQDGVRRSGAGGARAPERKRASATRNGDAGAAAQRQSKSNHP